MIFDRLELQNFGAYRQELIVLRPPDPEQPIVLFGGLNGAGKTTILEAIQLVLYGKRVQTAKREALSYEEYLRRCIHQAASTRDGASIKLSFTLRSAGVDQSIRVARYWRASRSGIRETLEVFVNDEYDDLLTNQWPEYIDGVIPAGISHLFFFDGEQIAQFAEIANARDLLKTAIHGLLGLDLIDRLALDLQVLERKKRSSLRSEHEKLAISEAEAAVQRLSQHVEAVRQRTTVIEEQRDTAVGRLANLDERYRREGGDLLENRGVLEERAERLGRDLDEAREELRGLAAGTAPLLLLHEQLGKIRVTDLGDQEREAAALLLRVLEERDEGLLNVVQSNSAPDSLTMTLREHLAEDREARAHEAQRPIIFGLSTDTRATLAHLIREGLAEEKEALGAKVRDLEALERHQADIERMLEAVPDSDAVAQLIRQRGEARSEIAEYERDLSVARQDEDVASRELEQAQKTLDRLDEKKVKRDEAHEEDAHVVEYSRRAREDLDDFRVEILRQNVDRIQYHVLESFRYLLRKQGLVRHVDIDPSSLSLSITGDSGQPIHPDRLSAGERQILAVSLLWGLAKASNRVLPMVVDTPLGRLDSVHRRHLVHRYFPEASHQVILLSTDEEIGEAHLEELGDKVGRSYHLDYDEALGRTVVTEGYFALEASP